MDHAELRIALVLALLVAVLSVLSCRLRVASPILMLVSGVALAFAPNVPRVALDPDVVLLLLLPPLLYSSGVGMSWRGFRSNLRPILLLAIGCVLFTAAAVAAVAHWALGLPWAVGFVLGAIVSPPDAVAPMAVLRSMHLPRRLTTILEGESLVNDATALVLLGFAMTAVATGTFSLVSAAGQFVEIVAGELAFGIGVGWLMLRARHFADDPRAEVLLALATPFIAFWPPHTLGGSGVIACVASGLYVSWNGRKLIRPATRLQGYFIWDLVVWAIESLVFLLAGLQARAVVTSLSGDGLTRALIAGVVVSVAVIVVRFVWVYPATYLPRLLPKVRAREPMPDWRLPFLVSFTGLRGAVSLAAALLIPATLPNGQPFPEHDVVLIATYSVIVITLVGLGASLPALVRALGVGALGAREAEANRREEHDARLAGVGAVLGALEGPAANGADPRSVAALRRRHEDRRAYLQRLSDEPDRDGAIRGLVDLEMRLIGVERATVGGAYEQNRLTDEARRRTERELDLEEARVRHAGGGARNGGAPHG